MTFYIVPVIEGQTEQGCVERLLHRVWNELLCRPEGLQIVQPFRGHRDELIHPNGLALTATVRKAFLRLSTTAKKDREARPLVLILLDAEGDCPATLAPRLLDVGRKALPAETGISCVFANKMFENWIVAGASTLNGVNDLPEALPARDRFEERGGAAWLEAQLRCKERTRKYKKTADAKAFVHKMDLRECRTNAPSFDKFCRQLEILSSKPPEATEPAV